MLLALLEGELSQDEYMYLNNIELRFVRLPKYVYGFIYRYKDKFLIAVNKNLSDAKKKKTVLHEFAHFEFKHCNKNLLEFKIENLEDEADEYVNFLLGGVKDDVSKMS